MPFDTPQDPAADPLVSRPRRVPAPLMLAGVAGACLLGAGLGLWARPSDVEHGGHGHPLAQAPVVPQASRRQIEIRVDGAVPAPALAAHPVAPPPAAAPAVAPAAAAAPPPPELLAPKPAPEGLMRVHAVVPQRLEQAPRPTPRLAAATDLAVQAAAAAERRAKLAAARKAEARAEAKAKAAAERQARAEAEAAAHKARLEKARVAAAAEARAHEKAELKIAAKKAAERQLAEQAAAKAQKIRLAQAKAEKAAHARAAAIQLADSRRKAQSKAVVLRASAPVRTANARPRCASADPGAALACTDPALGAADRQLSRAYRQAQAAGVPSDRLERQQQRWLAARANAARQAPWAVHDIYLSRIAELQDQTREASTGD